MELVIDRDGVIRELRITGGCHGNAQGLERLVVGRPAAEVGALLRGIRCEAKSTSCPDQLSLAIEEALKETDKDKEGVINS